MMSEWKKVKLGEVCNFQEGYVNPSQNHHDYFNGEIKWLRANDINNRYIYDTSRKLTQKGFDSAGKSAYLFSPNSLVISKSGTIGRVGIIKDFMCGNRATINITTNCSVTTNKYIFYTLLNKQCEIVNMAVGSVQKNLYPSILGSLEISLPPLEEQKAIADVLSALDDKIELNNKINKNLEEQAQAIFKRWFVDFDFPDENGNPYKSSGGEMQDSELGEIPKGWKISTIEKHVQNIDNRGKTPPLSSEPTEYPIIDVKALSGDNRIINFKNCTKFVDETVFNSFFRCGHPKKLDILISTVGSLAETKLFYGNKGCIAQNVIGFRSVDISPFYLFELLRFIKNDLIAFDIGTVQPSIKVTQFNKYKIILPSKKMLNDFDNLINSLSQKIYNNEQENQKLAELRDYLLPKLMSGEIRVSTGEINENQ